MHVIYYILTISQMVDHKQNIYSHVVAKLFHDDM